MEGCSTMSELNKYAPNSNKAKSEEEAKKVEKVVSGVVKTKKKSEFRKLSDIFISEDAANVKNYIFMDVLVPAIKKAVSDIVRDGIDMILYGSTGRSQRSTNASYVSYDRFSDRRYTSNTRETASNRTRVGYSYEDVIIPNRAEAEEVLSRMDELIEQYGFASVADLYDLVGVTGNYTDNKYGWNNLRNADVVRDREGYLLRLPKALPRN
jgi:hypothetical protein